MSAALELNDVTCVRGGRTLFRGLTRQVEAGQLLRVQGANGAGKTSLLRMLCGLLQPADGQILWRGQKIAALREEFGRELVFLGHAAALKDDLSPLENLLAASTLGGRHASLREARQALAEAGLRGHENKLARQLSQGQRRRSSLARLALAQTQPLWILDEPFNALDTAATAWLVGLVKAQLQRGGIVVLTSHQGVALDDVANQVLAL
jgi:heme exporter protein A